MEPIKLKHLLLEQGIRPTNLKVGGSDSKVNTNPSGPIKFDALTQKSLGPELVAHIQKYPNDYKIAKKIQNAKGYIWDNEYAAVKALLSIKTKKQFDSVQKIFSALTSNYLSSYKGRNIIEYVASFIPGKDTLSTSKNSPVAVKYIESLVKHLTNLGISKQTLKPLQDQLKTILKISIVYKNLNPERRLLGVMSPQEFVEKFQSDPEFRHEALEWTSLAAMFIPVVGLYVSAGISLADATLYYKEGDRLNSGYSAIFALLPVAGKGLSKLPFVQKLGARGMAALGEKLATSKWKFLNNLEIGAIQDLAKHKDLIARDLNSYFKARAKNELVKTLNSATSTGVKGFLRKVGDGTLPAYTLGKTAKAAAPIGAFMGAHHVANKTWDKIWLNNFQKADRISSNRKTIITDPDFQKAKKQLKK
jgi:hypothetical protein